MGDRRYSGPTDEWLSELLDWRSSRGNGRCLDAWQREQWVPRAVGEGIVDT